MKKNNQPIYTCSICKNTFHHQDIIAAECVGKNITHEIKHLCPKWGAEQFICRADLAKIQARYIQSIITSEKRELTTLELAVLNSLREQELLSTNLENDFDTQWTLSERMADKLASFGGSWRFLILFFIFLLVWIAMNSAVYWFRPFDPYPFIFLNLILSCVAAIQAPIIMMSQNRQEAKDRIRSQHDYQINLKAELEIRHLHEKVDHLLSHQWEKMVKIQELQLELLAELNNKRKKSAPHSNDDE